jgi:catechol 2,3-dioxygenase-like lactoylglutathione lyase family enzyme
VTTLPVLEYLVLRSADLERSRTFYEAMGLQLTEEQHGTGARHYACALGGGFVLELYPLDGRATSGLRLGLTVRKVGSTVEAIRRVDGEILRVDLDVATPSALVRDPDGHDIALVEAELSGDD